MYAYVFTPKSGYEYTIYMQGGVHGMLEMQGYAGLAKLMNLIADKASSDDYDPLLCMLRTRVRFVIVPIVNVWEVSETAKYNLGERPTAPSAARNSNNVNLNRNWFDDNPEQELVNIKTLLEGFTDIVCGFDCHTDPQGTPGWGSYLLAYANNMPAFFGERLKRVCGYLSEKNKFTDLKQSMNTSVLWDAYRGDDWNYPLNENVWADYVKGITPDYTRQHINNACIDGFWSMGILAGTLEHGANRFGSNCDNREMVAAVELYGNQVIEQVRCGVNLEKRIYDLENPS